jgi:hypothetical protein
MAMYPESITIHVDPDKIIADRTGMWAELVKDTVTTQTIVDVLNAEMLNSPDMSLREKQYSADDFQARAYNTLGVFALDGLNQNAYPYSI